MSFWLAVSLSASGLWGAILMCSRPGRGPWPPRQGNWPTAIWAWGLTVAIYVGLVRAGSADWNALNWPAWLRWGIGGVALSVAATWVQGRAIFDLGLKGTSGWDTGLVSDGAYAHRRHPQYLAQIVSLAGLAILLASPDAMIAALAGTSALLYASVIEDRDLAGKHPEAFARYVERVGFF